MARNQKAIAYHFRAVDSFIWCGPSRRMEAQGIECLNKFMPSIPMSHSMFRMFSARLTASNICCRHSAD